MIELDGAKDSPEWQPLDEAWQSLGEGLDAALGFFSVGGICEKSTTRFAAWHADGLCRSAGQMRGQTFREWVGDASWASVAPEFQRVLSGTACLYERRIQKDDGERWIEVRLVPFRAREQLIGFWTMVHDVTERATQERLLEAAWHRLEQFSHAATEGIAFYERGVLIDCNEALSRMLGRPREHLVGQPVLNFFQEQDRAIADRHIHLGRELPYPAQLQRPDGSFLGVEIVSRRANWQSGETFVACVRDVSQLNRVSESLMRSQARYRALVENAVESILFVQAAHVVYANPAASKLFGVPPPALIGEHILRLGHPEERSGLVNNPAFRQPDGSQMEVRVLCPPSTLMRQASYATESVTKWVRASAVEIDWENAPAVMIFMTDITLERESEERLLGALQQERDLGQLRTRFVSMASHEFRTPLATIQTSTELLQHYEDRLSREQRADAIADILSSVGRLQAMITNFLTLGRIQADAMRYEPRSVRVLRTLQSIVDECANADQHQHLIVLDIDSGIPAKQELWLDEMLLRLIVSNLLGNACKYSPTGSTVWMQVRPDTSTGQSTLVLSVSDQGIGIPAADLPQLFEPFHRATNTGEIRGTGVGLAIVRRATQSHGGTVELQTQEGQGSVFTIRLPWLDPGL